MRSSLARHMFSKRALEYDRHAMVQREVAARVASVAGQYCSVHGDIWIDAGCGTGALAHLLPQTKLLQIDAAAAMCDKAHANGHHTICADVTALPLGDGCVDGYLSSMCWQWVSLPCAVREMRRVCRPGAVAVVALPVQGTFCELREAVTACALPASVPGLPAIEQVRSALTEQHIAIDEETDWWLPAFYPKALAFLSSVHHLGAGGGNAAALTVPQMRQLLKYYDAHYTQKDATVIASYHMALWSLRL